MKALILVSLIFYLRGASAGVVVNITGAEFTHRSQSACRLKAYEDAAICAKYSSENDKDEQFKCLSDTVMSFINCTEPAIRGHKSLEVLVRHSIEPINLKDFSIVNIKCIVDNILDLIKCIVDAELNIPFKWNWLDFVNCVLVNAPAYIKCIPVV